VTNNLKLFTGLLLLLLLLRMMMHCYVIHIGTVTGFPSLPGTGTQELQSNGTGNA